jgi:tagaturonate reductase
MGCELVRDAVTHPTIGRFVRQAMLDEIAPTLDAEGATEFAEAVLERFHNPFIKHALIDITLQATMKMRVRVVPTIQRYVARTGRVPQSLAFGFSAFLLFMQGHTQAARREHGLSVPADDHAADLKQRWERIPTDADGPVGEFVWSVCRDTTLWGTDLTSIPGFCEAVADHLWRARALGVGAALEHHLSMTVA